MDTKETKAACTEAAQGLLAAHGELKRLPVWDGTRVPAPTKKRLNDLIEEWARDNRPPLAVHDRLADLLLTEQPPHTRYNLRMAMVRHLRDGWTGTGTGAPPAPATEPAPAPPDGEGPAPESEVERLVRQALAETGAGEFEGPLVPEPLPAPEPAPAPLAAEPDSWECGLCGLVSADQETLVAHVAGCEGPLGTDPEPPADPAPAPVLEEEPPADGAPPVDDSGGRYECALCGMVTEGQDVMDAHLAQCTGTEAAPRRERGVSPAPKPSGGKRAGRKASGTSKTGLRR